MAVGSNTLGLIFRIGADVGNTQAQLKSVTDQLKVGVDGMKGSVAELGSQFKVLGGFLEGLVAGGIQGFIEGVIKSATATADWVNELDRASQATSIEIRTLAQLEGAFKEAGGSLNSMIGTFDIFAGKLQQAREGNNKLIDILERYGIVSRDVTEATDQAFRALGSMTDQTEKARLAQELFGKGGARQILQFKDLKDGIKGVTEEYKALGDAIDPKLIEAAQAYEKESKKLDATLVANRAVIAGIVLPAWVEFNISIRKAMESLTSFKSLAEHSNEALDKFKIGPGLQRPPAEERGLEGEVVTEAEARRATEEGIAARSLEAARKVKDEKVKIVKQGAEETNKELDKAQKELEAQQKQTGDIIIKNMEDLSKGLNEAILAASDPKALIAWKLQMLDFADFLAKEVGDIIKNIAQLGQAVPGGADTSKPIPGISSVEDALKQLPKPTAALKDLNSILAELHKQIVQNINDAIAMGGAWGGFTQTLKEMFSLSNIGNQFVLMMSKVLDVFIQTGHTGPAVLRQLVAGVLRAIAEMSLEWGTFFLLMAIGFAALGDWGDAIKFGAAGVGLMALAAGLGFAASKVGPSQAGATAGAGAGFGGGTSPAPGTVTINQGATSALGVQLQILDALQNITTAPPGDILQRGADQNPMAVGQANNEAARRDGSVSREFLQISGLRTA